MGLAAAAADDEGEKVQTDWLHDFLMDPTPIRPGGGAADAELPHVERRGGKLVDYFAAASDAEFPYEYQPQQRPELPGRG